MRLRLPFSPRLVALILVAVQWAGLPAPVSAQPSAARASAWPQGGYDAGWSFSNPLETALDAESVKGLAQAWGEIKYDDAVQLPVLGGQRLFACSNLRGLMARAVDSGKSLWTKTGFPCNSPTLARSLVVTVGRGYPSDLNTVTAVHQRSGKPAWQVAKAPNRGVFTFNPPVVAGDTVFVTNQWSEVFAFSATTGQELWHAETGMYNQAPSVSKGRVYIANNYEPATVLALDAATGQPLWNKVLSESPTWFPATVAEGRVFVGTVSGLLMAVDARSGAPVWSRQLANYLAAPLVVGAGRVYASMGGLSALDAASGAPLWSVDTAGSDNLVLANGLLYLSGYDARTGLYLRTLSAETGQANSAFGNPYGQRAAIAVADGRVMITTGDSVDVFALPAQSSVRSRQISGNSTTSSILRR